jgi:MFS family permease
LSDASTGPRFWPVVIASGTVIGVTTGIRQSLGLLVSPLAATGLGIATVSFVLAVGQFCWGAVQPLFGALADRIGAGWVLVMGGVLLAGGLLLAPLMPSGAGLLLTLGVLSAAGSGAGSFSILIGTAAQRLAPERRAWGSGLISSGGSVGQFVIAPLTQVVLSAAGWAAALWALAAAGFATVFLARPVAGSFGPVAQPAEGASDSSLSATIRSALADPSYLYLHAAFFTCGFHIAFLVTHLPGEIALCGLPPAASGIAIGLIGLVNIGGSIGIGWLGERYRMKLLLAILYSIRAASIGLYLLAPKTLTTLYLFSAVLGVSWLATVPPTAGLVGKLFGTRHLSTLFGLTLLSHQTGAFFGAWLGGIAMAATGSYQWVWLADMALAAVAALLSLPVREAPLRLRTA